MKTMMVKQKTEVRKEVICDGCGTVIPDNLYQVTTSHDRWGNDSIESFETKHFCCRNCMNIFLDKYWDEEELTNKAEITYLSHWKANVGFNEFVNEIDEDYPLPKTVSGGEQ